MGIHLSKIELERYRQGQLSPQEASDCERHLAECAECLAAAKPAELAELATHWRADLNAAAREEFCLTEEQFFSCLEKEELAPAVNRHLAVCDDCRTTLREMRELQSSLSAVPAQTPLPEPSAWTIWEKGRAAVEAFFSNWAWAAWAAAAVVLLAASGLWLARRMEPPVKQVAQHTPSPQPTTGRPVPASALVTLNDAGGQIRLDENGNLFGLDQLPEDALQAVKTALQTQSVQLPTMLAELKSASSTLMDAGGAKEGFRLLWPQARIVRTAQPEFRWQALEGAEAYTVTVFQADFSEIVVSPPLTGTVWKPEKPLPRGRKLFWQVRATKGVEERVTPALSEPQAKFQVLEKTVNDRLSALERTHAESSLALGVLYAQAGLKEEAAAQFRALLKSNPDSELVKKLLAGVSR